MASDTAQRGLAFARLVGLALACAAGAMAIAFLANDPYRNADTLFHLRFGEEFRSGWPVRDPGQVTSAASNDWVPTQWLSQVGLSTVEDLSGRTGLVALCAVLLTVLATGAFLIARHSLRPGWALAAAALTLAAGHGFLSLRPQLISFILVAMTVWSWEWARRSERTPWWLIPIAWIWAMCHGMWIVGVAISAAAALGIALETRDTTRRLRLAAVPAAMVVAALLTPAGPRLLAAVFEVNSRSSHFAEWAPPALISFEGLPLAIMVALAVTAAARHRDLAPYDVVMLLVGGALAVYSLRTTPMAALVLLPLLCRWAPQRLRSRGTMGREEKLVVSAVVAGTLGLALLLPSYAAAGPAEEISAFDDALDDQPEGSMVVTDRSLGAAVMWQHPDLDTPIHGYGDVFTDAELRRLDDMTLVEPDWDQTLRDLGATRALLPRDDRLAYALQKDGWTVIEETDDAVYLSAPEDWLTESTS